jgi:hypothetical protein
MPNVGERASWSTVGMSDRAQTQMPMALAGAAALCILNSALAAPPPVRQGPPHLQNQTQPPGQHLDLRAPVPAADAAEKSSAFPSMSHIHKLGSQEQVQPSALALDTMRSRLGVQDFVRRVRQEGLPVARLLESRTALLHLGLNPKGKPGLWLVQKVR